MFYKTTVCSGYDETPHIFPLAMHDLSMMKQATQLHPEVEAYLRGVKPIQNKSILLIDAMGAGEAWGSNVNGDYFPEKQLMHKGQRFGYETFMHYAYPYLHHLNEARNQNPSRRVGDRVPLSVYHPGMKRVQLIAIVHRDKIPYDILNRVDGGDYPDVSMACGVKYDQCSICGKQHKTRAQYCDHARHQLRQILPDGRQVKLINIEPRFHDISLVFIGAEKASKVLLKAASAGNYYDLGKLARIKKIIPAVASSPMATGTLDTLSRYPIENVMATMREDGMAPTPADFQYMTLKSVGQEKEAQDMRSKNISFDPEIIGEGTQVPVGRVDERIRVLIDRSPLEKNASFYKPTSIGWPLLGGLYKAFTGKIPGHVKQAMANGAMAIAKDAPLGATYLGYKAAIDTGMELAKEPTQEDDGYGYFPDTPKW